MKNTLMLGSLVGIAGQKNVFSGPDAGAVHGGSYVW